LLGFLAFLGFAVVSQVVQRAIRHGRLIGDDSLRALVAGLASGALIAFGAAFGLIIALPGVSFTELIASLGVGGIILGFALRDILENFVAGILILARRPFVVGDQIRSGEHEGTVTEINFRSTVVRTYDGLRVFMPNGSLLTQPVENLTSYGERRSEISLAIHQQASVAEARQTILRELHAGLMGRRAMACRRVDLGPGDSGAEGRAPARSTTSPPPSVILNVSGRSVFRDRHCVGWRLGRRDEQRNALIRLAATTGADVEIVEAHAGLTRFGGVGALLRYRLA